MSTEKITIEKDGNWFVITDDETGVTTQGESKTEALLMLADALTGYEDSDEDLMEMARDVFLPDDTEATVENMEDMTPEDGPPGKPMLRSPLEKEEIEQIDDDELRSLAWDLDAIVTAHNLATDPTIPDLEREDGGTWIQETEKIRLEQACALLKEAYDSLYGRVEEDLEQHANTTDSSETENR